MDKPFSVLREALATIARDVERTESRDLHKIRRLAVNAMAAADSALASLETLFEERDGAALILQTARARITVTRLETDSGAEYRLGGDCYPLQQAGAPSAYADPADAVAAALFALEGYAS